MAEAVTQLHDDVECKALFLECGLLHHLMQPPRCMVDEQDVIRLHARAHQRLGIAAYRDVARLAGNLTGHYVRQHRIPRMAQSLIRGLPRSWSLLALTRAIHRHAWTFVGSGSLRYLRQGTQMLIVIEDSPLARGKRCDTPICDYYSASFEYLFRELVCDALSVTELECVASGAQQCVFRVAETDIVST